MRTVLDVLPEAKHSDPAAIQLRIAEAYAATFSGNGGIEDAEIVLVDMAQFTRYYDTAMMTTPADQVKAHDARRAVFQRVMEGMVAAGREPVGLLSAVLRAPAIDNEEN